MADILLARQLSTGSEDILSSLSARFSSARSQIADALLALKTAVEMGEISKEEKSTLKSQLLRGEGYDEGIIEKLHPTRQLILMKEANMITILNEEIETKTLECKVCMEQFQISNSAYTPHMLPCGHSFCLRCLQGLVSLPQSRRCCPLDRRPISSDISTFPVNFSLIDVLAVEHNLDAEKEAFELYKVREAETKAIADLASERRIAEKEAALMRDIAAFERKKQEVEALKLDVDDEVHIIVRGIDYCITQITSRLSFTSMLRPIQHSSHLTKSIPSTKGPLSNQLKNLRKI
jgi:hypothetical protein